MKISLVRKEFTEKSSIGELYIDDVFECYTLEDKDRELNSSMSIEDIKKKKEFAITAIPYGRYDVELYMSPRFKKLLPLIKDVKGFGGVLIHSGNKPEDSEGCILVGLTRDTDFIGNSRVAFKSLYDKIVEASKKEKIFIEITK